MFRFIHAADIHLDSPLRGLEAYDDAPVEEIRRACRRAFDNLVELAVREEAAFVLLAGDLFDGDWKDYNTGLFFLDRLARMGRHDIQVIMVSGNQDAASLISRNLRLPANVRLLSSRRPESYLLEEIGVKIHGLSYRRRAMNENPLPWYPPADPDFFNIGLLHTALNGRPGHEPYAPCTAAELQALEYDYWALGHVHQQEVVSREPWIVFPGNIQGRHIRETGPRGAMLVTVADRRVEKAGFRELDVLRWALCRVDLSACNDPQAVEDLVRQSFLREQEEADGRLLALRLELSGASPAHAALCRNEEEQMGIFRGIAIELGGIWLEKVIFKTSFPPDSVELAGDSPIAGLLRAVDETDFAGLAAEIPEIAKLKSRLPAKGAGTGGLLPETGEELADFRRRIREMLSAELLYHGEQP